MELLIIIIAVALALIGLLGGIWFWQTMAESPNWEQIRRCLKILGPSGALSLFAILISLVWMIETQTTEVIRKFVPAMNIFSWFLCFYMLGYDVSILLPRSEEMKAPHRNEKGTFKCHIKWDLLRKVLFAIIILIVPAVVLLLLSKISIYVFGMWVVGVVGFAMGFFFWEHLKEADVITGYFKRWLVILSLLTTVAIGFIAGFGFYVDFSAGDPESIRIFLVTFMLLIWGVAWYMLALCVVAFRAK